MICPKCGTEMNERNVDSLTAYHDTFTGFDSWQKKLLFFLTYRYVPDSISNNPILHLFRPYPKLKTYLCPSCGFFENNLFPYIPKRGIQPSRKNIIIFFLVIGVGVILLLLLTTLIGGH